MKFEIIFIGKCGHIDNERYTLFQIFVLMNGHYADNTFVVEAGKNV